MKGILRGIGLVLIIIGVLTLIVGIIMGLTVGTYLVSVFLVASMIINTVGITLLQYGKR